MLAAMQIDQFFRDGLELSGPLGQPCAPIAFGLIAGIDARGAENELGLMLLLDEERKNALQGDGGVAVAGAPAPMFFPIQNTLEEQLSDPRDVLRSCACSAAVHGNHNCGDKADPRGWRVSPALESFLSQPDIPLAIDNAGKPSQVGGASWSKAINVGENVGSGQASCALFSDCAFIGFDCGFFDEPDRPLDAHNLPHFTDTDNFPEREQGLDATSANAKPLGYFENCKFAHGNNYISPRMVAQVAKPMVAQEKVR
jgi:hypothetical protein